MDDLISEFVAETREGLEALDSELVRFEQNPEDPDLLGSVFRLIHTIKGTCGFLGLVRLQTVAHAAENLLGAFRDRTLDVTSEAVTAVLETVDLIRGIIDRLARDGATPMFVAVDGQAAGLIAVADTLKPESREAVLARWASQHGKDGRLQMHTSPGCAACDQSGFKGRAGLHELMMISRELRHLIQTGARAEALQATALREGMRTLRQDGIEKVLAGTTTIDEVRATSNV